MNKHKQLLSFSPKNNTTATDFNLLLGLMEKTSVWPIVFILGRKDSPVINKLKGYSFTYQMHPGEPLSFLLNFKFTILSPLFNCVLLQTGSQTLFILVIQSPKLYSHPQLHSGNLIQSLTLREICKCLDN